MTRTSTTILITLAVVIIAGLSMFVVNKKTHVIDRLYTEWMLNNREHFLPCEQLPDTESVRRAVAEHADVIESIKAVDPDGVTVEVAEADGECRNKADILIYFAGAAQRERIEQIIGSDTFFGVPFRMKNI